MIVAIALLASTPVVTVDGQRVAGISSATHRRFLGIAYAVAPVGERNGRPPQRYHPRQSRRALAFGAGCSQTLSPNGFGPWTKEFVVSGPVSDDCLFLNVWAPKRAKGAPILFWIHGGGFVSGSGSVPIYDGSTFAHQGVIVVTVNYRLGEAGFSQSEKAPPNLGVLDLVEALQWVRRNAKGFGGDPQRVTIAGQSAGAMLIHTLLAMPAAKGLFDRAIMESGLPPEAGAPGARLQLTPDLPETPPLAWHDGTVSDVPILIGMTNDETSAFRGDRDPRAAPANCGAAGPALLAGGLSSRDAASWCGRQALLEWWKDRSPHHRSPIYAYLFAHIPPGPEQAHWGAFHSSEIPYVFGSLASTSLRPYAPVDYRISKQMSAAWVRFINGRAPWPSLTKNKAQLQEFCRRSKMVDVISPVVGQLFKHLPVRNTALFK